MACYRVDIPIGVRILGSTASGESSAVLPGEYLVHRLRAKVPADAPALLRFVGADASGRDVHVGLDALRAWAVTGGVTVVPVIDDELCEAA